jgi:hypothetical protein
MLSCRTFVNQPASILLCYLIHTAIGEITGDENAQMEWKHYWRNVVRRHQVVIEGWPDAIPFRNLSETSNSLANLETLL